MKVDAYSVLDGSLYVCLPYFSRHPSFPSTKPFQAGKEHSAAFYGYLQPSRQRHFPGFNGLLFAAQSYKC
jgi:hypothetical protein